VKTVCDFQGFALENSGIPEARPEGVFRRKSLVVIVTRKLDNHPSWQRIWETRDKQPSALFLKRNRRKRGAGILQRMSTTEPEARVSESRSARVYLLQRLLDRPSLILRAKRSIYFCKYGWKYAFFSIIPAVIIAYLSSREVKGDATETFLFFLIGFVLISVAWYLFSIFFLGMKLQSAPSENLKAMFSTERDEDISILEFDAITRIANNDPRSLDRELAIQSCHHRSSRLRSRAELILIAIAIVIISGLIVIIYAGQLARFDASTGYVEKLKTALDAQLKDINQDEQKIYETIRAPILPGDRDRMVSLYESDLNTERARASKLDELYQKSWDDQIQIKTGYSDKNFVVITSVTRASVALFTVFLVQILMGFYRVNLRQAAHYSSLEDFLRIWDGRDKTMAEYRGVFAARVDFGKEPTSPTDSIMETLRGMLGLRRSTPEMAESQLAPANESASTGTRRPTANKERAEAAE
jgi:hypothetical protein